jgi:hypothetical protein
LFIYATLKHKKSRTAMFGIGIPETIILALVVTSGVLIYRWYRKRAAESKIPTDSGLLHETPAPESPPPRPKRAIGTTGHIFLSYASSDRPKAQTVANALSELGWTVWWDRTIPPGKSFDQVIEAALESAKCVIVLWSRWSVSSDWVKTEASEGARRKILVPVLIEDITIPLEFRRIQAANLIDWDSTKSHAGFESLARSVSALVAPFKTGAKTHSSM